MTRSVHSPHAGHPRPAPQTAGRELGGQAGRRLAAQVEHRHWARDGTSPRQGRPTASTAVSAPHSLLAAAASERPRTLRPLVRRLLCGPSVRFHSAGHVAASLKSGEPSNSRTWITGIRKSDATVTKETHRHVVHAARGVGCLITGPRHLVAPHVKPHRPRPLGALQRQPPMHHRPGVGVVYLGRARRASRSSRTEISPRHVPRSRRVWGRAGTSCRRSSRSRTRRARCRQSGRPRQGHRGPLGIEPDLADRLEVHQGYETGGASTATGAALNRTPAPGSPASGT